MPVLVYLVGHPEKVAVAESLAIVAAIAAVGGARGLRAGRVDVRSVVYFGAAGIGGASLGAWLARGVPGAVQLTVLAATMLAASVLMARGKPAPGGDERPRRPAVLLLAQGLAVGTLTGFAGVGGGFLIVPALVILGGLSMRYAVPTSMAIIAVNSTSGFLSHYLGGPGDLAAQIRWPTVLLFMALGILGSFAGSALGGRLDQRLLRRIFAAFLIVLAAYILWRELPGLF